MQEPGSEHTDSTVYYHTIISTSNKTFLCFSCPCPCTSICPSQQPRRTIFLFLALASAHTPETPETRWTERMHFLISCSCIRFTLLTHIWPSGRTSCFPPSASASRSGHTPAPADAPLDFPLLHPPHTPLTLLTQRTHFLLSCTRDRPTPLPHLTHQPNRLNQNERTAAHSSYFLTSLSLNDMMISLDYHRPARWPEEMFCGGYYECGWGRAGGIE